MIKTSSFISVCLIFLISCGVNRDSADQLKDSLTFYSSFDKGFRADFSLGDPELYSAPSWDQRSDLELFSAQEEYLQIHHGEGRYENALWIESRHNPVFFYRGKFNMHYLRENWSGTLSFWMRLDPEVDLYPGYSDPIQITSRSWNDGAIFVDFTEGEPRIFRFAVFADRHVWDPGDREWEDVPVPERPMIDVVNPPFSRSEWTHVALVFRDFNTGDRQGVSEAYINGTSAGLLENREQTFTWNPEEVAIWLGYNFRGYFDELSLFNRALSREEIRQIYQLENGIHELFNPAGE